VLLRAEPDRERELLLRAEPDREPEVLLRVEPDRERELLLRVVPERDVDRLLDAREPLLLRLVPDERELLRRPPRRPLRRSAAGISSVTTALVSASICRARKSRMRSSSRRIRVAS
jgi:hypothetical protein